MASKQLLDEPGSQLGRQERRAELREEGSAKVEADAVEPARPVPPPSSRQAVVPRAEAFEAAPDTARQAATPAKAPTKARRAKPTPAALPVPSPEASAAAREEVARHVFMPSTRRLPEEVLPTPEWVEIIDQGTEGISVGTAMAAVMNYLRRRQGNAQAVSIRMLYEFARRYDEWEGFDHEGSSLVGAVAALMQHGVCLEEEWPMGAAAPIVEGALQRALQHRPRWVGRVEKNIEHLRAAVFEHQAVVVAAEVSDAWNMVDGGVIATTGNRNRGEFAGVHAFAVIGYTSHGFIVQNSWGSQWGGLELDERPPLPGCAIWSFEDARASLVDAWTLQVAGQSYRPQLAWVDADNLEGDDLLEIRSEVNAFSYVLASRAIKPPLALGLFGDWGSGKSFFMQEMQKKIEQLAGAN